MGSFIDRAKQLTEINAVVDERFEVALREARYIDKRLAFLKSGRTFPREDDFEYIPFPSSLSDLIEHYPFLGVPFTVKENIKAKGN